MEFTDTQATILADARLLAREGKGQVLVAWAEPDAQELADAGWLERRTVDANGGHLLVLDTAGRNGARHERATPRPAG